MYLQKAIAGVDGKKEGIVKFPSFLASISLAFFLLFCSSRPASAEFVSLSDIMGLYEMAQEASSAAEFLDYIDSTGELLNKVNELKATYTEIQSTLSELKALKDNLIALKNVTVAYYKAQAVLALGNMLKDLKNGIEIADQLKQINDAVQDVRDIANQYSGQVKLLKELADTVKEIKNKINKFIGSVRQIKDYLSAIKKLYDAIAHFQNPVALLSELQNNKFTKNAIKGISNFDIKTGTMPSFDFNITGFVDAITDLSSQTDILMNAPVDFTPLPDVDCNDPANECAP